VIGAAGDPNVLASGLVAAIVLSLGLAATLHSRFRRLLMLLLVPVLVLALLDTASRGGFVSAAAAAVAAFWLMPAHRMRVAAAMVLAAGAAALFFAQSPAVWDRVGQASQDRGSGREDLWRVASRVAKDHHVTGIGIGQFRVRSVEYALAPGRLAFVGLIADRPATTHNIYLGLLAEVGVIGLALFGLAVYLALSSARLAARRFAADADQAWSTLCDTLVVAVISLLVAGVFLSAERDYRMWTLLAAGPLLLVFAPRRPHPHRW
jgi:O-antigen ligase